MYVVCRLTNNTSSSRCSAFVLFLILQIIKPSDVKGGGSFSGFGYSFAEFYPYSTANQNNDLDDNKYNGN